MICNYSKIFIRVKDLPLIGQSKNHHKGILEKGISVFEAIVREGVFYPVIPPHIKNGIIDLALLTTFHDFPIYEVQGDVLDDTGSIGEPLLQKCQIIKKINVNEIARIPIKSDENVFLTCKSLVNDENAICFEFIRENKVNKMLFTKTDFKLCEELSSIMDESFYTVNGEVIGYDKFYRPIVKI